MPIEWTEDLASGVEEIDSQHKLLISKTVELLEACKGGKGRAEADEMLRFMIDYCDSHFSWEENYMKKYNYPYLLSHSREHAKGKQVFAELKNKVEKEGVNTDTVVSLNKKLISWLLTHIRQTDIKMCTYIREKM